MSVPIAYLPLAGAMLQPVSYRLLPPSFHVLRDAGYRLRLRLLMRCFGSSDIGVPPLLRPALDEPLPMLFSDALCDFATLTSSFRHVGAPGQLRRRLAIDSLRFETAVIDSRLNVGSTQSLVGQVRP